MAGKGMLFLEYMQNSFENYGLWRQDINKKISKVDLANMAKYNSWETKFDIFFSPNGEYKKFEKLSDNTWWRCFAICASSHKKSFWEKFELEPSAVNQTKDLFECFWFLNEPMSIEDFESLSVQLETVYMLWFGKSVRDIYRVPETIYWEDNKWDGKTITTIFNNKTYTKQEFTNLLLPLKNIEINANNARDKYQWTSKTQKQVYETINKLDLFSVWSALLLKEIINKDWVIYQDWEATDYVFVKEWNRIHSPSDEEIWGNPFVLAKKYLKTQEAIYKFFSDEFNVWYINEEPTEIIDKDTWEDLTITTVAWDIMFDWKDKSVSIMVKNTKTEIIDWYIKPLWFFIRNKSKVCLVKYFKKNWQTWVMEFDSLWQTNKFDIVLSKNLLTFFWSLKVKKFIQSYIQNVSEEYIYIDKLGIYSKDLVISDAGNYIFECQWKNYYVSIEDETTQEREPIFWYTTWVKLPEVIKQIENVKAIYKSSIIWTMFTHFALSMLCKSIVDISKKDIIEMPYWVLVWLTQSGKTYMRKLLMRMFWLKSKFEIQSSTTMFVVIKKMRHYLPLNIGEYNTEEIKFDRDHFMKSLYDRSNEARWTSSQQINMYEANWTLFIDGENKSNNMAVYTRGIVYFMNPRYRMDVDDINPITRWFTNVLWYFVDNYGNTKQIPDILVTTRKIVNKALAGVDIPDKVRIASNYSLLLAFAEAFGFLEYVQEDILEQMNEQIKMMWDNNVDKIIKNIMTMAISHNMICDINSKWILTIDFIVDVLRWQAKKIDSIISDINTVNHHFWTKWDNSQTLWIPLDYIFKNKALHIISNNIFNMIYERSNEFSMPIARSVYEYAKNNGYLKTKFANLIEWHPDFKWFPF